MTVSPCAALLPLCTEHRGADAALPEYRMVVTKVDPDDILQAITRSESSLLCPTALRKWATNVAH